MKLQDLLDSHARYAAAVRRQIYEHPEEWTEAAQDKLEEAWPDYKESTLMVSRPEYQRAPGSPPATEWRP
eukprot:9976946-Prorocentrum_lima.AAC.1